MTTLLTWIITSKHRYTIIAATLGVLLLAVILTVGACGKRDDTAQVKQSAASAQAANSAGAAAVETAASVAAGEATIHEATRLTVKDIENAQDPDAVRGAVLERLCGQPAHRLDPACRVR